MLSVSGRGREGGRETGQTSLQLGGGREGKVERGEEGREKRCQKSTECLMSM